MNLFYGNRETLGFVILLKDLKLNGNEKSQIRAPVNIAQLMGYQPCRSRLNKVCFLLQISLSGQVRKNQSLVLTALGLRK